MRNQIGQIQINKIYHCVKVKNPTITAAREAMIQKIATNRSNLCYYIFNGKSHIYMSNQSINRRALINEFLP